MNALRLFIPSLFSFGLLLSLSAQEESNGKTGSPAQAEAAIRPNGCGDLILTPEAAICSGGTRKEVEPNTPGRTPFGMIGYWDRSGAKASWNIDVEKEGLYEIDMSYKIVINPGFLFAIQSGDSKLPWRSFTQLSSRVHKLFPIGKITLAKGKQVFSITLMEDVLQKNRGKGSIHISEIRLTPITENIDEMPKSAMPEAEKTRQPIEQLEMEVLRNKIRQAYKASQKSAPDIKSAYVKKLRDLIVEAGKNGNADKTKAVIDAIIADIDNPAILDKIKNSESLSGADKSASDQITKRFLVGKWKSGDGKLEYVFYGTGKVYYYSSGKRVPDHLVQSYSFNEKDRTFTLLSSSDTALMSYPLKVVDANRITVKQRLFSRVLDEEGSKDKDKEQP